MKHGGFGAVRKQVLSSVLPSVANKCSYDPFSIRLRVAAAKGAAVRINIADSCEKRTSELKTERASDRTKRSTMIERFCGAMAKNRPGTLVTVIKWFDGGF